MVSVLVLAGCGKSFRADEYQIANPQNLSLPAEARVMLYTDQVQWNKLNLNIAGRPNQLVSQGPAMTDGAKKALDAVFRVVVVNDPTIAPHLVIKVEENGRHNWSAWDGNTVTEALATVYTANGEELARFPAHGEILAAVIDPRLGFGTSFFTGFHTVAQQMLDHPRLAEYFRKGFPEQLTRGSERFLATLDLPPEAKLKLAQMQGGGGERRAAAIPPFPLAPMDIRFKPAEARPDDVAVIIGNADYGRLGRGIPDVKPGWADAEGMRRYAVQALGIKEENVIFLKDATGAQFARVFGTTDNPRGQLADWIKLGKSRVFVYYSGHGAPGQDGGAHLVPVDAESTRIELHGYPIRTLYANLARLPVEGITLMLEACFSGASQAGAVVGQASPILLESKAPPVPSNLTLITAGAANEVASWEQDASHGLFTKHFLLGMSGEADKAPHGDGNGRVGLDELKRYLDATVTYAARRHYGRDQHAQIVRGGGR
jgi:hypothetical protein